MRIVGAYLIAAAAVLSILPASGASASTNWPSWRGPDGTGANPEASPPTTWSETENIKWKIALPGTGQSTPIVWEDRIFVLTARPETEAAAETSGAEEARGRRMSTGSPKGDYLFEVVCVNREDGKTLWQKVAIKEKPEEGHHPTATFAPYSAVTDGKHLWASFGSRGLYCYDLEGNLQWSKPLPAMKIKMRFGEGSSPLLAGNAIVIVQDHEGESRIAAYNKMTGDMLWEKARDEGTTWSTPAAAEVDGKIQVIVNATNKIRSYDLETGELLWECGGMTANVIPTPIVAGNIAYCASGFRGSALAAIKLGHTGDLTGSDAIEWLVDEATPYVSTPLLFKDRLYFVDERRAKLSCVDAKTGAVKFTDAELGDLGDVYSSIVGAGDHVYVAGRSGAVAVLSGADEFKLVATNTLEDTFNATPVAVGNVLLLRGDSHLYCIAGS